MSNVNSFKYMGGTQKFPELLKKIDLICLFKFETVVPFEALPPWLDAAIPVSFPLLETSSKTFNRTAVKGCQRFSLNICNISKTPPFWPQNKMVVVSHCHPHPPTRLTSLLATSFCSQGWIWIWKRGILLTWQRFSENHLQYVTAFPLKVLDNVSSIGSSAWITASSHRGSTLKGLKFQTCTAILNTFF